MSFEAKGHEEGRAAEHAAGHCDGYNVVVLIHCARMLFYGLLAIADAVTSLKGD